EVQVRADTITEGLHDLFKQVFAQHRVISNLCLSSVRHELRDEGVKVLLFTHMEVAVRSASLYLLVRVVEGLGQGLHYVLRRVIFICEISSLNQSARVLTG